VIQTGCFGVMHGGTETCDDRTISKCLLNLQVFNFGQCGLMSVLCVSLPFTWLVILPVTNDIATNTVFVIPNLTQYIL